MTLEAMKKKVLGLIEELNPDSQVLTDDPDIATKIDNVINQVMFELARIKKLPRFIGDVEVGEGETFDFDRLEMLCGNPVYQITKVSGVTYEYKADGTVIKFSENGLADIEVYVYPTYITDENKDSYSFELSPDVLEVMPYGVAADLLKSDVSTNYGKIYAERYESMLQRLEIRYVSGGVNYFGGVLI